MYGDVDADKLKSRVDDPVGTGRVSRRGEMYEDGAGARGEFLERCKWGLGIEKQKKEKKKEKGNS